MSETEVGWDIPGWDWQDGDYSWLSSKSGTYDAATNASVFFIHGGRIRHQAHVPYGTYRREELIHLFDRLATGLDDAYLYWCEDTGGGDSGLWVEGTRAPNEEDLRRLRDVRARDEHSDRVSYMMIRKRHPEWFTPDVELDEFGRPAKERTQAD